MLARALTFDEILQERIGDLGRWQLLGIGLICFVHITSLREWPAFGAMQPRHFCKPDLARNWSLAEIANFSDSCQPGLLADNNTSHGAWNGSNSCHGWIFDRSSVPFARTLTEDFQLVCDRAWLLPFSSSAYFMGQMFGNVLGGLLSDAVGRKPVTISFLIIALVINTAGAFSPSYWLFWASRFLLGAFKEGAFTVALTLLTETISPARKLLMMVSFTVFHRVFCPAELSILAFLTQDWRWLCVLLGARGLAVALYFLLVFESPLWLLSKGRLREAADVINRAIRMNRPAAERHFVSTKDLAAFQPREGGPKNAVRAPLVLVFKCPVMFRLTSIMCLNFISAFSAYYSLIFFNVRLDGNPFLIYFLGGLLSLVPILFIAVAYFRFPRHYSLGILQGCAAFTAAVAALCLSLNGAAAQVGATAAASVSLALFSTLVNVLYIFAPELYPTEVRNFGLGLCSAFARIGCSAAHFVANTDAIVGWRPLPVVVYAALSGLAAICCPLLLDTRHLPMMRSVQELEAFCKKRRSTTAGDAQRQETRIQEERC